VPTDEEWQTLVDYCGGSNVAGGKLKSTSGWNNNGNGTDDFGFSVLPGGHRYDYGHYSTMGSRASFWSSSGYYSSGALSRYLSCNFSEIRLDATQQRLGYSVRCVRD